MSKKQAIIEKGAVTGIILVRDDWSPPAGVLAHEVTPADEPVIVGQAYDKGFVPLNLTPVITEDDVYAEADRRKMAMVGAVNLTDLSAIVSYGTQEAVSLIKARLVSGAWTREQEARAGELEALQAILLYIDLTAASMKDAPPADYTADKYWPTLA